MKYKKIIEDRALSGALKKLNVAEVAREVGVSRHYLYGAISGRYVVTEAFYNRVVGVVKRLLS